MGIGVAWFVLPTLAEVFSNLRIDLPLITQYMIQIGNFLDQYKAVVVPLFSVSFITLIYFIFFFPLTKFVGEWLLFHFPGTGRLLKEVELARFGFMMGTLVEAGLPVVDSIEAIHQMTTMSVYRKFYKQLYSDLEMGQTFADSFIAHKKSSKLLPPSVQQMITSAEQSGNLQKTFAKIGERYEAKTELSTKNISVILEPILLIIVWLGVVLIAVAIMLPIYSLVGNLNDISSTDEQSISTNETALIVENNPLKRIRVSAKTAGSISIVSLPDVESDVISKAKAGDEFEVSDENEKWYEIGLEDNNKGWISKSYTEEISNE